MAIETKPKPRKCIIVLSINKGTEKSFRAELFGDTLKKQHLRNLERESQSQAEIQKEEEEEEDDEGEEGK